MKKTVAIIGCGPRGLSALEDLVQAYTKQKNKNYTLNIVIFERTGYFGSGQVYAPKQTLHNWLNLNERALTISNRADIQFNESSIKGFPSFQDWSSYQNQSSEAIDVYPSRAILGTYLEARFNSIANVLQTLNILKVYNQLVNAVNYVNNQFVIEDANKDTFIADEVVLTVGHQPTSNSEQIDKWKTYAKNWDNIHLLEQPYPITDVLNTIAIDKNSKIAIRGFGLAMIDVARGIASHTGSYFEITDSAEQRMRFVPSNRCPKKIIPFSLDGLPMAPKPLNEGIDNWFKPSNSQIELLKTQLNSIKSKPNEVNSIDFLIQIMSSIIAERFISLKANGRTHNYDLNDLEKLIADYIKEDTTHAPILISADNSVKTIIESYINMATGTAKISLDFCIGQVWRHCQPTLYSSLSYTKFSTEVTSKIVKLDEKLKRLSFGPPVASLQQLLALIESGIMTVKAVEDPDIECTQEGWVLDKEDAEYTADIMINSVLDSTKITDVKTPLIKQLLKEEYIQPIHEELGAKTSKNGILVSKGEDGEAIPLALLGRLAQGTLLGVDAVLECFGERSNYWAKDVVKRLNP